jgi:ribosomal protein L20
MQVNRKMLAELAVSEKETFKAIVDSVKDQAKTA